MWRRSQIGRSVTWRPQRKAGARREAAAASAATIAEAFRITAAERPDEVAIRTKDDAFTITWGELRDARRRARRRASPQLGLARGDTLALMLGNRPEFHLCDLAAMMLGADAVLDLQHLHARADRATCVSDAEAEDPDLRAAVPRRACSRRASSCPELEHVIVIDGEAPEGTLALADVEGSNPDFDVEASVAADQADRRAHADLHLGHDRPAEGRAADPPQPAGGGRGPRRADRVPAGRARDLLAAERARRRAQRPPLPADRLRPADHLLRGPAPGALLPARSAPELVLRRAAHLGEAEGGAGDDDRRAARRSSARRCEAALDAGVAQGAPGAERRGGARRARRAGRARPTRRSSPGCARCSGSTRSRRSTSAPRRRRSRCSSSSTRSACRWPSCGA